MLSRLLRHPESRGGEGLELTADAVRRSSGRLSLRYVLTGALNAVVIPFAAAPIRADELWRRTCFEAFMARPDGGYLELNLAPTGEWASYGFDGYRAGMAVADKVPAPTVRSTEEGGTYTFEADLDLSHATGLPSKSSWLLAVSTVLQHTDGGVSYWALAHPPGKPDFHHPDSFVLDLPAPA